MASGSFDWISNYASVKKYLAVVIDDEKYRTRDSNILVVGCGTSRLSHDMAEDGFDQTEIFSCDIEESCIEHMKNMSDSSASCRLHWLHYDIVERTGNDSAFFRNCDCYFDVAIDKGTFDAILVEGCATPALIEIHRLLKVGGIYVLCSLHRTLFIQQLLRLHILGWTLFAEAIDLEDGLGSIHFFCKAVETSSIDVDSALAHEREAMDNYYQTENPLLTEEYKEEIKTAFLSHVASNPNSAVCIPSSSRSAGSKVEDIEDTMDNSVYVDLPSVYIIAFSQDADLGYSYELFLEDVRRFDLSCRTALLQSNSDTTSTEPFTGMTLTEIYRFIQAFQ